MTLETALEKVGTPIVSSKSGLVWAERRLLRAGQVDSKNGLGKPRCVEKTQLRAALITCFRVRPTEEVLSSGVPRMHRPAASKGLGHLDQ